ncbi:MAG TPA: GAF and ANTAR domain-containing protein [Iamia sp.]
MSTSDHHQAGRPEDLSDVIAQVARLLMGEHEAGEMLDRMTALAVETVDGAEHCGVSVVERGEVHTAGASDAVPRQVDQIQYDTGEGPCLDAIHDHEVFETGDIRAEPRWPSFVARADRETSVRSILCFRLYADEDTMGVLNLYSGRVDAFDDEDRHVASVFAAHAAVALSNARRVGHLQAALDTRDVIATAKGMLMAGTEISDDEAFDILRRASQRLNVKLRVVAERVVHREPMEGSDEPR